MTPGRLFASALASIALISPLAVHLFLPVIPAVKVALTLSQAQAQLTFSISLFTMAFATLAAGSLSDEYGRRPVLLGGLALFLAGSLASAVAGTLPVLLAGRVVQSLGAGCSMSLVRVIARDAYGPDQLVKAIAYLTMFYTLGPMAAPIVGGLLIDHAGWRSVCVFAFLAGITIAFGAYAAIPETRPTAAAGRRVGLLRGYQTLFGNARFNAFVLQTGLCTGMFMTMASASSSLMKELLHRPSAEFGLYFLLFPAGYFLGNLISSRIGVRVAIERMVLAGSVLALAAAAVQAVVLQIHVSALAIFLPGFFVTMAQGLSLPYGQTGAMAVFPHLAGTAAGVGVFMQNFCGALFAQLYGFAANGTAGPMIAITSAAAALCLTAGAVPLLLSRTERKRRTGASPAPKT